MATLEARVLLEEKEKKKMECQLSELRTDYENYKIRATSVLKKQKTEAHAPASNELSNNFNTDKVECEMLQRLVDALKLKVSELEYVFTLSNVPSTLVFTELLLTVRNSQCRTRFQQRFRFIFL